MGVTRGPGFSRGTFIVGILIFSRGFAGSEKLKLSGIGWLFTGGCQGIMAGSRLRELSSPVCSLSLWIWPPSAQQKEHPGFSNPSRSGPQKREARYLCDSQVPSKNPDCHLGVGLELYDLSYPEVPSSSEA